MKYRKKPVVIDAVQWTGRNLDEILEFCPIMKGNISIDRPWAVGEVPPCLNLTIPTLEGDHLVSVGDYVIRGIKGEFYPCKPDIFAQTYEEAGE